ncbi:MAG: asparagine--tRNA ligase [Saprospirales bacterium]|nr:MAG: asparagine--tRNA ligase [Saprospirales bacterium]
MGFSPEFEEKTLQMKRIKIRELLHTEPVGKTATVKGWVRTFRNNQFVALNDGSCLDNLQLVLPLGEFEDKVLRSINPGAAISATGEVAESRGRGQKIELVVSDVKVVGESDPEKYPLQPKKHSLEFLREQAHLRFRTNTFGAIFRIRHAAALAIHRFFDERGFVYLHTPILTASDAEGAGELFRVTTLNPQHPPLTEENEVDFSKDFFGKEAHLTVSGQLEAELGSLALSDVYTFGPTFRAEHSHTTRHLAEFWMIEPEIAFADLEDNMDLAEDMLNYLVKYLLENCRKDLEFLDDRLKKEESSKTKDQRSPMGLTEKLEFCLESDFARITYSDAIDILMKSKPNKKKKFQYVIEEWGADLQSEHERYLVEKHFKKPVILYNYPKNIKAFYMRVNDDEKTVAAMDILFPGIGEIIGGSQREERLDVLLSRMDEMHIPQEELSWYLDIRKYGSCPHAGYGLGFERFVQFVTGMGNIRDVIPFPRTPGHIAF